jgi:hypothetical protein
VDDVTYGTPFFPIRHENHPLSTTGSRYHRLRMTTGIYSRPAIDQFLDRLARIEPNKCCSPGRCSKDFSILFCPALNYRDNIILHLIESLIDDRPAPDVGREVSAAGISSPESVDAICCAYEDEDDLDDS